MIRTSFEELALAPEFAALVLLEAAADTAVLALAAAYPELQHQDDSAPSLELRVTRNLLGAASAVSESVHRYCLAIRFARRKRYDSITF